MKILMVLTSHDQLGNTGRKTGFWLKEFAAPYFVFRDAGADLTLTSPKGGQPPIDPKSDLPENQTPAMARFKHDSEAQKALSQTLKLSDMKSEDFDTIFYVGGHGPMWDLVDNPDSIALIESFYNSGKPVAAVCHSPAVFHRVMFEGVPLVKGKRVTGFTNGEEEAVHLTKVVPFLVEDELKRVGGLYKKAADWESFAIVDGRLVTGQNPASSTAAAKALITLLREGAVTGAFAYFAGSFSTDGLTPSRFADRFEEVNGVHTGFRRNHAKGLGVSGFFESNGNGVRLSKATVFEAGRVQVIGRFSLDGGQPYQPDRPDTRRGLGLEFSLPHGELWRSAMISFPLFPVRTPEIFTSACSHASRTPRPESPIPPR